jgi:hypothetical protein
MQNNYPLKVKPYCTCTALEPKSPNAEAKLSISRILYYACALDLRRRRLCPRRVALPPPLGAPHRAALVTRTNCARATCVTGAKFASVSRVCATPLISLLSARCPLQPEPPPLILDSPAPPSLDEWRARRPHHTGALHSRSKARASAPVTLMHADKGWAHHHHGHTACARTHEHSTRTHTSSSKRHAHTQPPSPPC